MRALLALLLFAGPLLGQAPNGWAPIENGWAEIQVAPPTGTVTTTGTLAAGQVALGSGATSVTGDSGLTYSGSGTAFKLGIGTDVFISRASAGLLVEDGSGNARDVQVRDILGVSNVLNQRNGTNAQTFHIYQGYTDASNYGRLELGNPSGGYINVFAGALGTGPYSSLMLGSATGYVYAQSVFAPAPFATNALDLGSAAASAVWRTGYFGTSVVTPVVQLTLATPTTSGDTCTAGTFWADASYLYVCTATNTIKRAALSAF